jgi:hypothetical protein
MNIENKMKHEIVNPINWSSTSICCMRFEICMEDGFILELLCKGGMKGVGSIDQEKGEGRLWVVEKRIGGCG